MAPLTQQQDPYTRIANEIREELATLLQQQDACAAGSIPAASLQPALDGVDEQLIALEDAVEHMVASPSRFNLPLSVAYHRQAEVQQMRLQHQRLSRLSSSPAGPVAGGYTRLDVAGGLLSTACSCMSRQAAHAIRGSMHRKPATSTQCKVCMYACAFAPGAQSTAALQPSQ
jgi:hypothetical protein